MKVYHYHPITNEYLGVDLADESPLEPNVFLIPAYSTDIEPPEELENKVRVFKEGAWIYEDLQIVTDDLQSNSKEQLTQEQAIVEMLNIKSRLNEIEQIILSDNRPD